MEAVVAAANSALLDDAILERSAAMTAVASKNAHVAVSITECDEVLAKDPYFVRHLSYLTRQTDRLPESADVFAERRTRTDPRDLIVRGWNGSMKIAAVGTSAR
jgi:hypothetical protein